MPKKFWKLARTCTPNILQGYFHRAFGSQKLFLENGKFVSYFLKFQISVQSHYVKYKSWQRFTIFSRNIVRQIPQKILFCKSRALIWLHFWTNQPHKLEFRTHVFLKYISCISKYKFECCNEIYLGHYLQKHFTACGNFFIFVKWKPIIYVLHPIENQRRGLFRKKKNFSKINTK